MPFQSDIESLLHIVESELIPHLLVNRMLDRPANSPLADSCAKSSEPDFWSSQEAVEAFAVLCIENDPRELDKYIADLLIQGVSVESIFLFLMTPAAQHLGVLWSRDQLSFVDVQLGLCRLHQLICQCEVIGCRSENVSPFQRSILLTCAPGENHTFGVTMVADFFRRDGWLVSNFCGFEEGVLLDRLSADHYSVIGFSLHNESNYDALKSLVLKVKLNARNKNLKIMVGGDYFVRYPNEVVDVGADVFASDGRQAIWRASAVLKDE